MRSPRVPLLALVAAASLVVSAAPAAAAPPALDAAVQQLVTDGVPGAMALSRQGNRTSYATAGVANLATHEPLRTVDRYRIGSETKSFTATVVLKLEAQHKLSIDDTVEHWLPGLVPNGSAINLRMLLNHTSGLADYTDEDFYRQIITQPLRDYTPRELIALGTAKPPVCAPGACWSYANTNYILLGLVIDAAEHVPASLERYGPTTEVYARILAPLGLRKTSFPVSDPGIPAPAMHGYAIGLPPEWGVPGILDTTRENISWGWTAGAMISTLDDNARFYRALFAGQLLPQAQMRELLTTVPVIDGIDYGLGVFRYRTACGDGLGHDGGTPSHLTMALVSADGSRQAVIVANRDPNTFTDAIWNDWDAAINAAFCGTTGSRGGTARSAALAKLSG
jgi:D-alanyl-D-alanine carboxypeptidase